jgi:2-polyprenyl-3-methyl-5-hydroxy-6-metoxy-1,4-benzoquinol methylase
MSRADVPSPPRPDPPAYWEERARRFARQGAGLAAVCSYGMPEFHNRAIQLTQRLALRRWLRIRPGTRVLDVGCGIGRWSRRLAARGAAVTGVDLSPTMIAEAARRAVADGCAAACRFRVGELSTLALGERFDLVLGVTVLQHVLDPTRLRAGVAALAAHLAPDGRLVLLEAAPLAATGRCDSGIFVARTRQAYLDVFRECGLEVRTVTGVDPAPFRTLLLPLRARLSPGAWLALLALATALSVPIDALFGRRAARQSWHAVFVLQARRSG